MSEKDELLAIVMLESMTPREAYALLHGDPSAPKPMGVLDLRRNPPRGVAGHVIPSWVRTGRTR